MTRSTKQVGSAMLVALGLAVYVGCGAPPSAEEMRVGATSEALGSTACVQDLGLTAKWLPSAGCSCAAYTGAVLDQCVYEMGVLSCLKYQGYQLNCAALPPLPITAVNENHAFVAFYEDIDFNTYLPGNCAAQANAYICVKALNATRGPSGTPNTSPSVSAALLRRCAPAVDTCRAYPTHADFDPCTTKACYN